MEKNRGDNISEMNAAICRIRVYAEKGAEGKDLSHARLIENRGLEGDYHATGGDRQISIFTAEDLKKTEDFFTAKKDEGLCVSRFRENIMLDGLDAGKLKPGMLFMAGEAVLEITSENKHCHDECPLYKKGKKCPLAGKNLFAKVIKSGEIHTGDLFLEEDMDAEFTHFDSAGSAIMVDVSEKKVTSRTAAARGIIAMNGAALKAVLGRSAKKGDVLGVARIAGIMAAKKCAELIPLCHPLIFDKCTIDFKINEAKNEIEAECEVKLSGKTGAEMEALTGVSVALLTVYDMCKALDKSMVMNGIRLVRKTGGKSDLGEVRREK